MSDLWLWYAKVATPAEAQNAEPGDPVQRMYECVYATTAVCLMALGYPDTEPTDLMNLVHPGGHVGGEDYGVVAQFLRSRPQLWPNLPSILLINPPDTLGYLRSALAAGYAIQVDVKDDRNANVVAQWPAGWKGTHSVIVVADAPMTVWNPWRGDKQTFSDQFFKAATLNPAGNFMVFQRDIRTTGGTEMLGDDVLVVLFQSIQQECFGAIDPSGQGAFVAAVKSGVGMNTIKDGWMALPQSVAYRAALASLVETSAQVTHLAGPGADPAAVAAAAAARKQLHDDLQKVVDDLAATNKPT